MPVNKRSKSNPGIPSNTDISLDDLSAQSQVQQGFIKPGRPGVVPVLDPSSFVSKPKAEVEPIKVIKDHHPSLFSTRTETTETTTITNTVDFNIEDNILTEYANFTYKFTLFIAPPEDVFNEINPIDPREAKSRIILTESGASSRLHIHEVEIESGTMPTFKTKNMQVNKFKIQIHEPKGFSLMDLIFRASLELGIPNYMFSPYYLALDFIAYNDDGVPFTVPNASKIWAIKILNISVSSNSEGSIYDIDALEMEHITTSNHISIIDTNYKIAAITVGNFFNELGRIINANFEKQRFLYREEPDEIRFEVDPEIAKLSTKSSDNQYDSKNLDDDKFYAGPFQIFNVPKGMDVSSIVNNLMVSNEEWVKLHMNKKLDEVTQEEGFNKIWTIETDIVIKKFDYFVNDYARIYIFRIVPYKSLKVISEPSVFVKSYNDQIKQEKRLIEIFKNFEIRKKYDYIYTGTNTEVMDLDIEMNYVWTGSVPLYKGLHRLNFSDVGSEITTEKRLEDLQLEFEDIRRKYAASTTQQDLLPGQMADLQEKLQEKSDEIRAARGDSTSQAAQRQRELAEIRKTRGVSYVEDLLSKNISNIAGRTKDGTDNTQTINVGSPLPYSISADGENPDTDTSLISDGKRKQYRSLAGAILNNIYTRVPDLLEIDINIKGDPYWLGVSQTEARLERANKIVHDDTVFANTKQGDTLCMFNMKFPIQTEIDGINKAMQSEVITGIYSILKLQSTFSNGMFTQRLSGIRDHITNLILARGEQILTFTAEEIIKIEEPEKDLEDEVEPNKDAIVGSGGGGGF